MGSCRLEVEILFPSTFGVDLRSFLQHPLFDQLVLALAERMLLIAKAVGSSLSCGASPVVGARADFQMGLKTGSKTDNAPGCHQIFSQFVDTRMSLQCPIGI